MKLLKSLTLVLICLFAFQGIQVDSLEAQTKYRYHKVRKGDTLGKIARRYRTTVGKLRRLNRMSSKSVLMAGKNIRVGTRKATSSKRKARYHKVRRGDTLGKLARRYRTTVSKLRRLNGMSAKSVLMVGKNLRVSSAPARKKASKKKWKKPKSLPVGHRWLSNSPYTKVLVPLNYKIPEPFEKIYNGNDYGLRIFAEKFAQGHAGYIEIRAPKPTGFPVTEKFEVKFHNKKIPITPARWGYRGLFAIPPNRAPGNYRLSVIHTYPAAEPGKPPQKMTRHFTIPVGKTRYRTHSRRVYLGRAKNFKPVKPAVRDLIRKSTLKRAQVFRRNTGNKITSRLAHPRDMHKVTSPFYVIRTTHQWYRKGGKKIFKKPRVRPHKGLDLRGRYGQPIFAMADGRVALAQRMHYEGNFTVIDHGNQIFTGYMHQTKLHVREGQVVRAGQLIGTSGNTGASRGPHLHLSLWIRGVPVQPLSLLSLPIR